MKKINAFITIILVLSGCKKEQITHYEATLLNKSTHKITLLLYYNNPTIPKDTIQLNPNQSFLYGRGYDRGLNYQPGF